MHIRTFLKPLSFLPALLMMYIIFTFSAQEADLSSSVSHRASVVIVKTADYVLDLDLDDWRVEDYASRIHKVTRKLAHMTEYFLLAVSVSFPLYVYGLHGILLVLVAGVICVGYACGDEYHQSFIQGRSASGKDVLIDSFGVLIGIILVRIIGWTGRHTIFRPIQDERSQRASRRELKRIRKQQRSMQKHMARYEQSRPAEGKAQSTYVPNEREEQADPYYSRSSSSMQDPYKDPYYGSRGAMQDPYYDPRYTDPRYAAGDPYYNRRNGSVSPSDEEASSDELSEDMPFSKLFRRRR